jgi:cell division protein FtsI (penicillin-binding protein 3)
MRLVVLVAFLSLTARLVQVQVMNGQHYSALAVGQVTTVQHMPAMRGGIYDRDGAVLAISVQRNAVIADPFIIHDAASEAEALAPVLDQPEATIASELTEDSGFVYLARLVDDQVAQQVQNLNLEGINILPATQRVYPSTPLASSLIGAVDADGNGESGLEYQYNSLLSGQSGTLTDEQAPSGVVLPDAPASGSAGQEGDGIELTLDEPLQYVAESSLSQALLSTHAVSGTVVVMNVHNGDILAMANMVSDRATHRVSEASQNLALTNVYEPGSVFKLVTFTAALQAGAITPTTDITIPPYMVIDGSVFHDAEEHGTEVLSATQVLAQSSNLGTIEIARRLGATAIFDQMQRLGIGRPTGLGFPGESAGIVEPLEQWGPTDLASTAIGQNTAVTPMQVLDMMNSVATGGVFVPPRLVQAVVQPDGSVREVSLPREHRVLSHSVTSALTGMLEQVIADGTAPGAAVAGYTVAGKTGTAQIPNPNAPGYLAGAYMATFTGFAPAQNPALSAIVVLNRPTPIFGGTVAAPVFSKVMSYALERYGVPPSSGQASTVQAATDQTYTYPASPGHATGGIELTSETSQVPASETSQVPAPETSQVPAPETSQPPVPETSQPPGQTGSQAARATSSQAPGSQEIGLSGSQGVDPGTNSGGVVAGTALLRGSPGTIAQLAGQNARSP